MAWSWAMLGLFAASLAAEQPESRTSDGQFIVHEWGTFTSYSGSDGVRLDFRPLVEHDLPTFVHDWAKWTGNNIFGKAAFRTRQRMETPVTYFYTDRVREVNVQVRFPSGILTEFYPPVRRLEPHALPVSATPGLLSETMRDGLLDWGRVTLIPQSALRPSGLSDNVANAVAQRAFDALPPGGDPEPELYTGDHYYYARETDSAIVHTQLQHEDRPQSADGQLLHPLQPMGDFFEKFLFYRGLGNFDLPLTVDSRPDGRFGMVNSGSQPLAGLILIQVRDSDIRFARLPDLPAGEARLDAAPEEYVVTEGRDAMASLAATTQQILTEQGLYEKEATAMLQTWRSSWFTEEGTRLLYIVPRSLTDELLPLSVAPAPRETVRVLVGRMEILPRGEEQRLHDVVASSARERQQFHERQRLAEAERAAAIATGETPVAIEASFPDIPAPIQSLGRFAEPALVRIANITTDATIAGEAAYLLAKLRQQQQ